MTTLAIIAIAGGAFYAGWESHRLLLRRLHKLTVKIRRIQQGGKK